MFNNLQSCYFKKKIFSGELLSEIMLKERRWTLKYWVKKSLHLNFFLNMWIFFWLFKKIFHGELNSIKWLMQPYKSIMIRYKRWNVWLRFAEEIVNLQKISSFCRIKPDPSLSPSVTTKCHTIFVKINSTQKRLQTSPSVVPFTPSIFYFQFCSFNSTSGPQRNNSFWISLTQKCTIFAK